MQEVKLAKDFQKDRINNLTKRWNLPARNINFTGRESLLDQVSERLSGSKPLVITACHGLGGVGKTQLVTEFAYRNEKKYERIIWVSAESSDQIETAYLSLGQDLGIIPEKTPPGEAVYMVKTWLSNHPRNLVIFDNVENSEIVQNYILSSGADILITSRNTEWTGGITVDVFSLEEAVEYFIKIVGERVGDTKEKIEELVQELGRLPLALAQAAAYIRENKISIEGYLDLYLEKKAYFLSQSVLPEGDRHIPVYLTFDLVMTIIENEASSIKEIVNIISFLHYSNITSSLFDSKYERAEEMLGLLARYSLISFNVDYKFSIHSLLQQIIRMRISDELIEEYVEKAFSVCIDFAECDKGNSLFFSIYRDLLPHFEVLLPRIKGDNKKSFLLLGHLYLGHSLFFNMRVAMNYLSQKLLMLKSGQIECSSEELASMHVAMAFGYESLGETRIADQIFQTLPSAGLRGPDNVMLDIPHFVRHTRDGQASKAADSFSKIFSECEKLNPQFTRQLQNILSRKSKLDTPESKMKVVLDLEQLLETEEALKDPRLTRWMIALETMLQSTKVKLMDPASCDTEQACQSLEKGIESVIRDYGKESEYSAKFFLSSAPAFTRLGRIKRSCELLDSALTILNREPVCHTLLRGEGHIDLARNYFVLSEMKKSNENARCALELLSAYPDQGIMHQRMIAEATTLVEKTRSYGTNEKRLSLFPQKIKELRERALTSYKKGDYITAISLYKACLDLYNSQKVVNEINVASTCYNLGSAYWKIHDASSALVYLNQALELRQKQRDKEGSYKVKQLITEIQIDTEKTAVLQKKSSQEPSM